MSFGSPAWTINNASGEPIISFTSFLTLDLKSDGKVVSTQVEEGSFASYNKTESPLEIDVQLGIEGSDSDLQKALDAIAKLKQGTELVNLVTPNAEYKDLNLESYSYGRKSEDGLGVLWLDLSFVEIRQVKTEYSNEKLATQQKRGKQQAKKSGNNNKSDGKEKKRSFAAMILH